MSVRALSRICVVKIGWKMKYNLMVSNIHIFIITNNSFSGIFLDDACIWICSFVERIYPYHTNVCVSFLTLRHIIHSYYVSIYHDQQKFIQHLLLFTIPFISFYSPWFIVKCNRTTSYHHILMRMMLRHKFGLKAIFFNPFFLSLSLCLFRPHTYSPNSSHPPPPPASPRIVYYCILS